MSSKRGRKRNDNLPPNRARDVQRAFRARRAAHLQALELRVTELEEENNCLRQALNLPPANRTPLGKGPTGKDKPKSFETGASQALSFHSGKDSSSPSSPASTRTSSLSPSAVTSMSSRSMQVIEGGSWDSSLLLSDQPNVQSPTDSSYMPGSMSAPVPTKPLQYSHYSSNSALPSPTPRSNIQTGIYISPQSSYSQSPERNMGGTYSSQAFVLRQDMRDDSRHPGYSYSQSTYSHEGSINPSGSPPPSIPALQPHPPSLQREHSLPYPHRRSLTDPQGFSIGQGYPHLPSPAPLQGSRGQTDLPRLQDNLGHPTHSTHRYSADGRINSMS
ncbi:hypothetical protein BDN72DRAFT_762567 [Pluteus cervinus]|uniref:Uncharacterized protein n=1 Tax=Pluteus cervinus TaxID=181527 RepID=A0ACD3B7K6_9AGAR|nr:hypothetical protein BDN72DRAFT_762567 [Pluteus cervinus]